MSKILSKSIFIAATLLEFQLSIKMVYCDILKERILDSNNGIDQNSNTQQESNSDSQSVKRLIIIAVIISICLFGVFICLCTICTYFKCKLMEEEKQKRKAKSKPKSIIKLDFVKFSEVKNVFNIKECAICLDEFQKESEVTQFKSCNHIFHKECMLDFHAMKLLETIKKRCPLCKVELNTEINII